MTKIMCFLSLLFTGLILAPGMAHLLEMPHKMELSIDDYKVVQTIYRGWSLLGIIQSGAVISTLILLFYVRQSTTVFRLTLIAFLCLALTLVIFFIYTYPVNAVTHNWTKLPQNWMDLRLQWEYAHATSAVLELVAFILLIIIALNGFMNRVTGSSGLLTAPIY